jgi:hypothetical protein
MSLLNVFEEKYIFEIFRLSEFMNSLFVDHFDKLIRADSDFITFFKVISFIIKNILWEVHLV